MPEPATLFTIGHSRHKWEHFLALLKRHAITLVVDTRGRPYSRFNPHFNRERFARALAEADIAYQWRGEALSGRPKEARFYRPDGGLDVQALWDWPALKADLGEVAAMAGATRLALLCAEENPMTCHRRFLLTAPLRAKGIEVVHIRGDGRLEPETDLAPLL